MPPCPLFFWYSLGRPQRSYLHMLSITFERSLSLSLSRPPAGRYLKPLQSTDVTAMVDAMLPMMNAIKMIHTIARYYNTSKALTTLLSSVAQQVVPYTHLTCF